MWTFPPLGLFLPVLCVDDPPNKTAEGDGVRSWDTWNLWYLLVTKGDIHWKIIGNLGIFFFFLNLTVYVGHGQEI